MATFLTTSRMDPALAARIEQSVRGKEIETRGGRISPRITALWRVFAVIAAVVVVYVVTSTRRRDRQEFDVTKVTFLATVREQAARLSAEDRGSLVVMESWLARGAASTYEGDVLSSEVAGPGVLAGMLAQPAVYVRGPIDAFSFTARIRTQAALSSKDATLLCLVDPPKAADEKTLLGPVRLAYTSALLLEQHTAQVRRLNDAVLGLPLLSPEMQARIGAAGDSQELGKLRREWNAVPADHARQALTARLLIYVFDEPGSGGGPTELDGERQHDVRVGVVDLTTSKVLLRTRQKVDPAWISPARKAEYAAGLDGCQLASHIHDQTNAAHR